MKVLNKLRKTVNVMVVNPTEKNEVFGMELGQGIQTSINLSWCQDT